VRVKETDDTQAGVPVTVVIQSVPAAPTGISASATSDAGRSDGVINGTTAQMEYGTQADFSDAADCSEGSTTGLAAGTYYVRVKASGGQPAGEFVTVTIPTGRPVVYSDDINHVSAVYNDHAQINLSHVNVQAGTSVTVTIVPDDGYLLKEVRVNGETVPLHGRFTLAEVNEDTRIEVVTEPMKTEAQWTNPYPDVKKEAWYYDAVSYATRASWMNGTASGFQPLSSLTRAMFVTVLYRFDLMPEAGSNPFRDIREGSWYDEAVAWGSESGVVMGTGSGKFSPDSDVTREQMATFLYRYAAYRGMDVSKYSADLSKYSDADKVSAYAVDAMRWAVGCGLIGGRNGNMLAPGETANRAEAATVLCRLEDLLKK
jgi:hypothetical protein